MKKRYKVTHDHTGLRGYETEIVGEFPTRKAVNAELAMRDKMLADFQDQNNDDLIVPDKIKNWEEGDTYAEDRKTGARYFINNIYEGLKWEKI